MKKILTFLALYITTLMYATASGLYVGGGLGDGMQNQTISAGATSMQSSLALRAIVGYQLTSWLDSELGYTYIMPTGSPDNLQPASSTIYDLSVIPGFTIPATPVTVFVRLGVDAVSANLNSSWYNELASNSTINFEYGLGAKVDIPGTNTFIRAEYINFGSTTNNNAANLNTTVSGLFVDAAYIF